MSSLRNSSNHGTKPSSVSQKNPSFLVRFIKGTFFQVFVFFTTIILLGVGYAAWTTLDPADAENGKPVTQNLMQGIINNINDLDSRVTAVESQTTGGTVTGPLRWSSEYGNIIYNTAWTTCLALTPIGDWRLPTPDEMEYARRMDSTLFTGNKFYWSSSPGYSVSNYDFLAWGVTSNKWFYCKANTSGCSNSYDYGNYTNYGPMAFRCVSNAN